MTETESTQRDWRGHLTLVPEEVTRMVERSPYGPADRLPMDPQLVTAVAAAVATVLAAVTRLVVAVRARRDGGTTDPA